MSDSLAALLAQPRGIDVLSGLQNWQNLAQSQAQTGVTQQQEQAASLANQLQALQLARTSYLYNLAGIPTGQQGAGGAAQAAQTPAPSTPTNQLAALAGAQGQQPGGAGGASAPTGAAAQAQDYAGSMGATLYGVPMPRLMTMGVMTAADPTAALKTAVETRRQALYGMIDVPPEQFPQAVEQAYQAGYITPQMRAQAESNPNIQQQLLQSFATPESHLAAMQGTFSEGAGLNPETGQIEPSQTAQATAAGQAAAKAGGGAAGALPYAGPTAAAKALGAGQATTTSVTVPDPTDPTKRVVQQVLTANLPVFMAANAGAQPTSTADMFNPGVSVDWNTYGDRVTQHENAGGANPAATSGTSSAAGNGQFLDSTWLSTVASAHPAWADGLTPTQILAARSDPEKSQEMTIAYGQQNASALQAAGFPVNTQTVALAHAFGAGGAEAILSAAPSTPVSQLVPKDVMTANPQYAGKTAAQVTADLGATYGTNPIAPGASSAAGTVPGAIPGAVSLTPQGQMRQTITTQQVGQDAPIAQAAASDAQTAQQAQTQLLEARRLISSASTGAGVDVRQGLQNALATFTPQFAQSFVNYFSGGNVDPNKTIPTSELNKILFQNASLGVKATLGANGGIQALNEFLSANPNVDMQAPAIRDMVNLQMIAQQRAIDYGNGAAGYYADQQQQAKMTGNYTPLQSYQQQFNATHQSGLYAAAAGVLNGNPYSDWSKGLTPKQQSEALRIVWRADPSATLTGPDGKQYSNPALAGGGQ